MGRTKSSRLSRTRKQRPQPHVAVAPNVRQNDTLTPRARNAFAHLASTDRRFKVLYLVPHEQQSISQASFFGAYTPALHRAAGPLNFAAQLPADVREPYATSSVVLQHRLMRRVWPHVVPIQLNALLESREVLRAPFRVFFSNDEGVAHTVDEFIATEPWPCLHISSLAAPHRILDLDVTLQDLLSYFDSVLDSLAARSELSAFVEVARTVLQPSDLRPARRHALPLGSHNVTAPNEIALRAHGWELHEFDRISDPITAGDGTADHYITRICKSADAVFKARESLVSPAQREFITYRYILAVPGIAWGHFARRLKRDALLTKEGSHILRTAYRRSVRAISYFDGFTVDEAKQLDNPECQFIFQSRAADAHSFTAGLSLLSAASLAPVLRLEPKLNQIRGDLKQLTACVRAQARHHFHRKQSRMTRSIGQKLRSLMDVRFLERIDRTERGPIEGLKIASDLPIELAQSGDLPLSLRFDVSRIPVVPGNLFIALAATTPVFLTKSAFAEVLIVRSFQLGDPLRQILDLIRPELDNTRTKLRVVDVTTEDELVSAVNAFNGALMIFDGHGSFDHASGAGTIIVGNANVDAWTLRSRCVFPPIVIFSACETQPLDGSHGSSGTAALSLGARTVLATTLPIDGRRAGHFIARLVLRLSEFLPLVAKFRCYTWRSFVSGLLRMTHVTETMSALQTHAGTDYARMDKSAIQLEANTDINQGDPNWYRNFVRNTARAANRSTQSVKADIAKWAAMTDSLKYIQLGSPETIVLVEEDAAYAFATEAERTQRNRLSPSVS